MILPSKSDTTHVETHFDDTGRAEAEAFISEIEGDGAKAGEVFAEVAAKAESANTSAGELASRVKRLEDRPAAPASVIVEANLDTSDRQRRYVTFNASVPDGWEATAVSITPPAGWYRIRLWTTLNAPVTIAGAGISGDVPLAHVGLTAPAVDMVAQVSSGINVRYRADGPATFRLEVTPIITTQ